MLTPTPQLVVPHRLQNGEVHLWLCRANEWEAQLPALAATLSTDERERIARYRRPEDRANMTIGRGVMRQLLAELRGRPAHEFAFGVGAFGKPYLVGPEADLCFNVSHTEGLVAIALATDLRLGVDVEFWRESIDYVGLAERYFSEFESQLVASTDPRLRLRTFFQIWTRKEAYVKAVGLGLSQPLDQFWIVAMESSCVFPRMRVQSKSKIEGIWSVETLSMVDGYSVAVAAEGEAWQLKLHCKGFMDEVLP